MRVTTVRDFGALVRAARRTHGMTQADLADRMGVSREWVVRLEAGHPRLEVQKVLDALAVLGLIIDVEQQPVAAGTAPPRQAARKAPVPTTADEKTAPAVPSRLATNEAVTDPFESLFAKRTRRHR